MNCWYCGSPLVWQNDFNYDEIYGDGEGIVSFLKCTNPECNADVEISKRFDEEE